MTAKEIKPIPKYIHKLIEKEDAKRYPTPSPFRRFYGYLTRYKKELIQITVAVKHHRKRLYCKQVAVHGVHADKCFIKDIRLHYMAGYIVGWYEQGLQRHRKWFENEQWDWAYSKHFHPDAIIVNTEYALKFPEYKYSMADKYDYSNLIKYLRIYEKYPQAEMLIKLGLTTYATSIQILRKVGEDKSFRKWLINNREELKTRYYYVDTLLLAYKTNKALNNTQNFLYRKKQFDQEKDFRPIRKLFKGKMLERFFNYIDTHFDADYRSYLDYVIACTYIGLDMSQAKNAFPHDFKKWHDIRTDQYQTAKTEDDNRELALIVNKYLPLQNFTENGLVVFIAKNNEELKREGEYLHHCVGRMNYDQRFIREESLIFFIRKKQRPNVPFVTVEYSLSQKKVLQCYGKHDNKPNSNVLEFVNKRWLPYANRQLKKIQAAA